MILYHGPRIYCPPGVPRPAWMPGLEVAPPIGAVPEWADHPPGLRAVAAGGTFYPPPGEVHAEQDWRRLPSGAVVLADGLTPARCARLAPHPRIRACPVVDVQGADDGQVWHVPVLLQVQPDDSVRGLVDGVLAYDEQGREVWSAGPVVGPLLYRLADARRRSTEPDPALGSELVQLAADVLALGYHVDRGLLIAMGWLTATALADVIRATIAVPEPAR